MALSWMCYMEQPLLINEVGFLMLCASACGEESAASGLKAENKP